MTPRGEFALIADLFAPLAGAPGALGLRDDVALVQVPPGEELAITVDTVIAGVHFRADDPPELVARKALRVNLSDLAAKGATPVGILQALTLGGGTDDAYLERYARGLADDLAAFDVALLGGDTTATSAGPLMVSITALGTVPQGTALLRSGAQAGNLLCVSGTIGDAALGLRVLDGRLPSLAAADAEFLIDRYRLPQPRLALGRALRGLAGASIDLSDGLCADVGHVCAASGVAAEIAWPSVPLSPAAERALAADPALQAAILGGGDDYELAFAVRPDRLAAVQAAGRASATPVTAIGRMIPASGDRANGVRVHDDAGRTIAIPVPGFTHR